LRAQERSKLEQEITDKAKGKIKTRKSKNQQKEISTTTTPKHSTSLLTLTPDQLALLEKLNCTDLNFPQFLPKFTYTPSKSIAVKDNVSHSIIIPLLTHYRKSY